MPIDPSTMTAARDAIKRVVPDKTITTIESNTGLVSKAKSRLNQIIGTKKSKVVGEIMDQVPLSSSGKAAVRNFVSQELMGGDAVSTELSTFIATIRDFARPNLFKVELENLEDKGFGPDMIRNMSFLCKSSTILFPTFTEGTFSVNNLNVKTAVGEDKDPITLTFMVDSNAQTLEFFDKWRSLILDPTTKTFGYKSQYAATVSIGLFNRRADTPSIYTIKYINAYPTAISGLELGWEQKDTISEITVTFNYDDFTIINRDENTTLF